ncbi:hypothetical protein [Sphingobacterium sp. E70]|uniref:hypothetical protein n=1 Tax=Sphingobacterium sp. E70 TaxID=2853439 RepID=UPI002795411F|nr:hypothetical protein [Sphingobacterium sp. E70]
MKTNILIVDDIHEIMLEKFAQAGIAYDYRPDIDRAETEKIVANYSGMVIRSKFQVDKPFLTLHPTSVLSHVLEQEWTISTMKLPFKSRLP